MTLERLVDGRKVQCSAEEELVILAEREANKLPYWRERRIREVSGECVRLISRKCPALSSIDTVELLDLLWPLLNTNTAGTDLVLCRAIFTYAKNEISKLRAATLDQLEKYDAFLATSWPN